MFEQTLGASCIDPGRRQRTSNALTRSFEYAAEWLSRPGAFAIDPTSLPLRSGAYHGKSLFRALHDCGPDRWGRVLAAPAGTNPPTE